MASRIASSASATFMIGTVGPNVSSVIAVIEWSTSASTVGSKKRPAPSRTWPPAVMRAPAARAWSTWVAMVSSCGPKVMAPTSTLAGPCGGPTRSAFTRSVTASTNRS